MSNLKYLKNWFALTDANRLNIYIQTGNNMGLSAVAVEKDWWVVHTLAMVFSMDCAASLIFKGGTSLSKGWKLIQRFSEDIDMALDREYLGFSGELNSTQIGTLRKRSFTYMTTTFIKELINKFSEAGFTNVEIKFRPPTNSDQDPIIIEVYFPSVTEKQNYLKPGVLLEVGCRSLTEPHTNLTFGTMVAENFSDHEFSDAPITMPVVNPERTFLEKIFLLHEEFQKPVGNIRIDRLSRHLYDIEKLSQTEFATTALHDPELYNTIVEHRKKYTKVRGIDYAKHAFTQINFIPPNNILNDWKKDYEQMQENMIYGEMLSFSDLIEKLTELKNRINKLPWS